MEFIPIWIIFGIITLIVALNKGLNGCIWFILGFMLGPVGLILALVVQKNEEKINKQAIKGGKMKKCPYCAELIKSEAKVCRYCGREL